MSRLPVCPICNKAVEDKTIAVNKINRWYHSDCYDIYLKEKEEKKKLNQNDYDKLISYIYKLYDGSIPKFIFKQIKEYKEQYDMTDMGILLTLKFIYETLEMNFDSENGIGLCLYYYDKAKKHWMKNKELQKAIDEFEFDDTVEIAVKSNNNNEYFTKMKNRFIMEDV